MGLKNIILPLVTLISSSLWAQNPYAVFGLQAYSDTVGFNLTIDSLSSQAIPAHQMFRFSSLDDLFMKYPASNPYHFTDNSPVYRQEQDGQDWIITTTKNNEGRMLVHIVFTGAILNSSGTFTKEEMLNFRNSVEAQIKEAYTKSFPAQTPQDAKEGIPDIASVSIDVQLRLIQRPSEIKDNDHLIEILTADNPEWKGDDELSYTAGRAGYYSNYVKINARAIPDILKSSTDHTVPHELGHTLGLKHHAEAQNLMYAYTTSEQTELGITPKQIAIAVQNSDAKNLNWNNIPYIKD